MNHDTPTLLRPEEARSLAARAFAYARADGTEITLSRQSTALTRLPITAFTRMWRRFSTQLFSAQPDRRPHGACLDQPPG